jgi:YbbR domain-containing protein
MNIQQFRLWPFRNIGLKAIALVLALILWISVKGAETVFVTLPLDLSISPYPDTLLITNLSQIPENVDVTLFGPLAELFKLSYAWSMVRIKPEKIQLGDNHYTITATDIKLPKYLDLQIHQIVRPREIILNFAIKDTVKFKITPQILNNPSTGFIVTGQGTANPESVTVIGPKKILQQLSSVNTTPIDISTLKTPFSDSVSFEILDCEVCTFNPQMTHVTIPMEPILERLLTGIPVEVKKPKGNYTIEPNRADVRIAGLINVIDSIDVADLKITVQTKEWQKGKQYSLTGIVNIADENIKVLSIEPSDFLLNIP